MKGARHGEGVRRRGCGVDPGPGVNVTRLSLPVAMDVLGAQTQATVGIVVHRMAARRSAIWSAAPGRRRRGREVFGIPTSVEDGGSDEGIHIFRLVFEKEAQCGCGWDLNSHGGQPGGCGSWNEVFELIPESDPDTVNLTEAPTSLKEIVDKAFGRRF